MKRALALVILSISTVAAADSKLLVLHSEGKADVRTRAKVDGAIMKLAKTGKDTVQPSEITYSDAAAMVGCKPDEASCRDEVINTLAVDELLIVVVNPKPPGFEVTVKRAGKAGQIREQATTTDTPDKLDALGPMFGLKGTAPNPPVVGPPVVNPPVTNPPVTNPPTIGPNRPPVDNPPVVGPPVTNPPVTNPPVTNPPVDNPPVTNPPVTNPPVTEKPPVVDSPPKDRHRLYLAGMGGGGGMIFLGIILWGAASSTQGQIDSAPTTTKADLQNLKDLESRGDSLAGWGNVFAVTGLVVAGVSTYFYVKNRRSHHTAKEKPEKSTTVLAPAVFDHGAGLTLSFGGFR